MMLFENVAKNTWWYLANKTKLWRPWVVVWNLHKSGTVIILLENRCSPRGTSNNCGAKQ